MNTTWNTNLADHNNLLRAKTYTNSNRVTYRDAPIQQPLQQPVDLPSMYFDQNTNSPFYQPYQSYHNVYSAPNMYSSTPEGHNGQQQFSPLTYTNNTQPSYQYQQVGADQGALNPYAMEFNPVQYGSGGGGGGGGNQEQQQYGNQYSAPRAQHYKEEFTSDSNYQQYTRPTPHRQPPARVSIQEPPQTDEAGVVPEGAVTVSMPHVYLGKFMMNRAEYENKYGVTITTNSMSGGYLIIIVGEKAEEASKDVATMWNEEPITTSEAITQGKHVIKVAPDRYEGVVCVPVEFYTNLLAKRDQVESKHKVRILVRFLQEHQRYRAVIRANKKQVASDAADFLESIVMTTETAAEPSS